MDIKTYIQNIVIIILFIIVQVKFSYLYSLYDIKPDILLIFLIRQSIKYPNPTRSMIRGFFAGIVIDLVIGDVIGASALIYSIAGFATSYYKRNKGYLAQSNKFTLFLVMLLGSSIIFYYLTLSNLPLLKNIFFVAFPSAVYGVCIIWTLQIFKPIK